MFLLHPTSADSSRVISRILNSGQLITYEIFTKVHLYDNNIEGHNYIKIRSLEGIQSKNKISLVVQDIPPEMIGNMTLWIETPKDRLIFKNNIIRNPINKYLSINDNNPMSGILVLTKHGLNDSNCSIGIFIVNHRWDYDEITFRRQLYSDDLPLQFPLVWPGCCRYRVANVEDVTHHDQYIFLDTTTIRGLNDKACMCTDCYVKYTEVNIAELNIAEVNLVNNSLTQPQNSTLYNLFPLCTIPHTKSHTEAKGKIWKEFMLFFKWTENLNQRAKHRRFFTTNFSCYAREFRQCISSKLSWIQANNYCKEQELDLPSFNSYSEIEYFLEKFRFDLTNVGDESNCVHRQYQMTAIFIGVQVTKDLGHFWLGYIRMLGHLQLSAHLPNFERL